MQLGFLTSASVERLFLDVFLKKSYPDGLFPDSFQMSSLKQFQII